MEKMEPFWWDFLRPSKKAIDMKFEIEVSLCIIVAQRHWNKKFDKITFI